MNVDIGEVLTRAWQITWKNKALWWFGILFGLLFSFLIALAIVPIFLLPGFLDTGNLERSPLPVFLLPMERC